jgi:hypothetical protein
VPVIHLVSRRCEGCSDCSGDGTHYIAGDETPRTAVVRAPRSAVASVSNRFDDPRLAEVVQRIVEAIKPDLQRAYKAIAAAEAVHAARLSR